MPSAPLRSPTTQLSSNHAKPNRPTSEDGKAITRLNATKFGIYSVTPVVPAFERQDDWLAHHDPVFADLQPEGYVQEIIAERIAIKPVLSGRGELGGHAGAWRLRRLVRYEREQIRHRQRNIPVNLALHAKLSHRKPALSGRWDSGGHEVVRDNLDEDLQLIDRWAMDALIPGEKELAILHALGGPLTRACPDPSPPARSRRKLRLDMLHLEHLKRQKREDRRSPRAAIVAIAEPTPADISPLPRSGEGPGVRDLSLAKPEPESLGDLPVALRQLK